MSMYIVYKEMRSLAIGFPDYKYDDCLHHNGVQEFYDCAMRITHAYSSLIFRKTKNYF